MDKMEYIKPCIEEVMLEREDVIRTSGPDVDGGEGWI